MALPRTFLAPLIIASIAVFSFAAPEAAQGVTPADIDRLQDAAFEAGTDVSRLRTGDVVLVRELREELAELREEITYFKVKLRRREPVARAEYAAVRDRI